MDHLMSGTEDPALSQREAMEGLGLREVGRLQALPSLLVHTLQIHQDELAGVPELVAEVAG